MEAAAGRGGWEGYPLAPRRQQARPRGGSRGSTRVQGVDRDEVFGGRDGDVTDPLDGDDLDEPDREPGAYKADADPGAGTAGNC